MPGLQTLTKTRLTGEVIRIRFDNAENGFVVFTCKSADGNTYTVKGEIPGLREGVTIEAEGYFENHPEFGRQFRVESCRIVPPSTTGGITRFLQHAIHGIGPKTAAAIVEKFGKETVTVLDMYPMRLLEVK